MRVNIAIRLAFRCCIQLILRLPRLCETISCALPGDGVPGEKPFTGGEKDQIDFAIIEAIIKAPTPFAIASVLEDPGMIPSNGDFASLVGNPFLLG